MSPTITQLVVGLVLVGATAVLTFLAALHWHAKKVRQDALDVITEEQRLLRVQVSEIKVALGVIGATIQPLSVVFQAALTKQLTHMHTPEMDALLAMLDPFVLTIEQEARLAVLLAERTRDMGGEISDSERDAAMMLPFVMKRVRAEKRLYGAGELKLVIVPPDHE